MMNFEYFAWTKMISKPKAQFFLKENFNNLAEMFPILQWFAEHSFQVTVNILNLFAGIVI